MPARRSTRDAGEGVGMTGGVEWNEPGAGAVARGAGGTAVRDVPAAGATSGRRAHEPDYPIP
jgi:hypothetical protein